MRDHSFLNDLYGGFTYYNYLNDANPLNESIVCKQKPSSFSTIFRPDYYANRRMKTIFYFSKLPAPLRASAFRDCSPEDDY